MKLLANIRVVLVQLVPFIFISASGILAWLIWQRANPENRANYISAHFTAVAAIAAVLIAVWLEWRKDQTSQKEQAIRQRLGCHTLRPLTNQLISAIETQLAVDVTTLPISSDEHMLLRSLRNLHEQPMAAFDKASYLVHHLPSDAAVIAASLLGELAVYRSRVEAGAAEPRMSLQQGISPGTYHLSIKPQLDLLEQKATQLVALIDAHITRSGV